VPDLYCMERSSPRSGSEVLFHLGVIGGLSPFRQASIAGSVATRFDGADARMEIPELFGYDLKGDDMVRLRFDTNLYTEDEITVRNSIDGWSHDISGTYANGGWVFSLDGAGYESGFEFKFFLPQEECWAWGPNLVVAAGATGELAYSEAQVKFQFVLELDPADYLAFNHTYTLRTEIAGWDEDLPATSVNGDLQQWALDWGTYRDRFQYKFLVIAAPNGEAPRPVWMLGENLSMVARPGEYHTYRAEHQGPIAFPFFIRLVGDRYAGDTVTIRDSQSGWMDRIGGYVDGAWQFAIPWTDFYNSSEAGRRQVQFKFALNGRLMTGPNLVIGPERPWQPGAYAAVGAQYDYLDSAVQFTP